MVVLLTKSYKLFQILIKHERESDDVEKATTMVKDYMDKWREMMPTLPPKAHIIDDHAIEQFVRHFENGLYLVIEQFVEQNHQNGRRLDDQCKRVPDQQTRANTHCKRKALDGLAAIRKRQKEVHEDTAREKNKPKNAVKDTAGKPRTHQKMDVLLMPL